MEHQPSRIDAEGPIRVLFVNDHLVSGGAIHGAARYFLSVLPHFNRSKVHAKLCILRHGGSFAEEFEAVGVQPIFLNRGKWDPRALTDLTQLVHNLRIEVLHLSGMKGCLLGQIAARITGRRTIVHLHDINPLNPVIRFLQQRLTGRWTQFALVVSEAVRRLAVRDFNIPGDRIEVLHNPIEVSNFANPATDARERIRKEFQISSGARVMGIIGRLSPEKGHTLLIQVLPTLLATCPEAVLLIVGDGPMRKQCESLVQSLQLGYAVRFAGYRTDIADILAALDVVVMPSDREGFGLAALEATAAGKPVVASRVGGLPEIVIDGETGLLVPSGEPEELLKALLRILTDTALAARQSEACRLHAQKFTVEQHIERLQEIYRSVALCSGRNVFKTLNSNERIISAHVDS